MGDPKQSPHFESYPIVQQAGLNFAACFLETPIFRN